MKSLNLVAPPVVSIQKTCCHCGVPFRAADRELICPACRKPKPASLAPLGKLSFRQHQVAVLAAQGGTNQHIANRLRLSQNTVKAHLASAYRKLGVQNRTELAYRAAELLDRVA